ncbi:NAD(P)H-dependent glycerol-3-phosphate dehydrogenase [Flavimaricola marinus]|uniref:Glycerol-3-phosphate dehydrogenase [NAD(P)+] n=1 Tax=Flavimaricola marinus TaxID=1819565 RepID=A0A238LBX1_9RHOB|nr:NAD(P)H-dependent glycerol-3-phosphate dehydrogenase [Flavimaricola marinus]SMY07227.1 Glycerol-3-phosphate dehydrogenase [NAD(P)+] [Flavimaricola marinus]
MTIAVAGAGAFGTALAITLARAGRDVTIWGRDPEAMAEARQSGRMPRLAKAPLPDTLKITADAAIFGDARVVLLAVPAQKLGGFLSDHATALAGKPLVACCKGIDLATLTGPSGVIAQRVSSATAAILTGPSFADDIAIGLPTALTLACRDSAAGETLQEQLTTPTLRLYRTTDVAGAELGGALKNVIAIACGACIGAGLGQSARAALMTRGFAEMVRIATQLGAEADTLAGLSGLGDLALTCTSDLSRNYRYGVALGQGQSFDAGVTVEGAATALAMTQLGAQHGLDLPVTTVVNALVQGDQTVAEALQSLLSRPLKEE